MFARIKAYASTILIWLSLTSVIATGSYFLGSHNGYQERDTAAKLEQAESEKKWTDALLEVQNEKQRELEEIGRSYQQQMETLKVDTARTIDDLRKSGNKLRIRVSQCETAGQQQSGVGGPVTDGYAELSDSSSQFLIGEAQRADAWIKHLQRTVEALQGRKEVKP